MQADAQEIETKQSALPLVLLPGTLCDARVFGPLRERLADVSTQVLLTLEAHSLKSAAEQVLAQAPERFALLGFSLGGMVAMEVALRAPERVLGLALVSTTPLPVLQQHHAARLAAVEQAQGTSMAAFVRERLWPEYGANPGQGALLALFEVMAESLGHRTFAHQTRMALAREDLRPRLNAITCPALVLAGSNDTLCPPLAQEQLAAAIGKGVEGSTRVNVPGAGHLVLLEKPDEVAAAVAAWFHTVNSAATAPAAGQVRSFKAKEKGDRVSEDQARESQPDEGAEQRRVLQVERRDFTQLVPDGRPRVQSMRGFDPVYTDIVDYIVRCTHRIWDERDVGLIYTHYTHNCVLYGVLGTMYDRESIVRETIQRIVELPDRRGMATSIVWRGDDVHGFYTSHMTHGTGRHTEYGIFGKPTGRTFVTRTIVDCMILENKIYREWVARDNMAQLVQLGIDPQEYALAIARKKFEAGEAVVEIAENRRLLGQYPPETEPDLSLAHTELEADVLRWLHHIFNKRMFGKIGEIYASNCQWHGPLMRELYGPAAVMQQTMRLVATVPDCAYVPQHICSVESEEGGTKVAIRWVLDGHHLGYGSLGPPTGLKLVVMGFTHLHVRDGKIIDEWTLYDELSMLVQLKLGAMQRAAA